ncbi:MAG: GWxTD domain-containing protein, partial [Thermoanaerobaculia bacterium]
MRALSDTYRQFLLDVDPIIEARERDAFLSLESDAQRDVFIENFWRRHAPVGMSGEAFRIQYYEVIEQASKYHRSTDRYKVFVIQGPPADIVDPDCRKYLQPIELWRYVNVPGLGHDATLLFYVPLHSTEYVLWHPMARNAYEELLTYEGLQQGVEAIFLGKIIPMTNMRDRPLIESDCKSSDLLRRTIDLVAQSGMTQLKALEPRVVSEEPMKLLLRSMVMADPKAAKLTTELSLRFPRKDGSRTDAEITVLVPRAQLSAKDLSGANTFSLDVTGEVLRDDSMFEKYRYRFDLPANGKEDKLPLIIDRILPHGDYKFRLKIVDVNSGAEAILEKLVTVPEDFDTAEERQRKQSGSAVVSALKDAVDAPATQLRIVPLPDEILSGLQHIETIAVGDDIKAVEFYLDGHKVMTKRQPPYTLDLDFGSVPRARNVRAIALDAKGQPITGDEITLNTGTD